MKGRERAFTAQQGQDLGVEVLGVGSGGQVTVGLEEGCLGGWAADILGSQIERKARNFPEREAPVFGVQ